LRKAAYLKLAYERFLHELRADIEVIEKQMKSSSSQFTGHLVLLNAELNVAIEIRPQDEQILGPPSPQKLDSRLDMFVIFRPPVLKSLGYVV